MNGLLEDGITLTQPDTPRPPFWEYMTPDEKKEWHNIPILRQSLTNKYNTLLPRIKEEELMRERDMLMRRSEPPTGLLYEGETQLPENYSNLNQGPRWYQLPSDQGLLEYGTQRGDGLSSEQGYHGSLDYPEHAPDTPEHHEVYNFLRKNNFGGGI